MNLAVSFNDSDALLYSLNNQGQQPMQNQQQQDQHYMTTTNPNNQYGQGNSNGGADYLDFDKWLNSEKFDDIDDVIDNTRQINSNNEYATSLPENNTYTATPTEGSPSGPSSSNVPPSIKKELGSMASSESCKSSLSSPNSVDITSDTSPLSDVISPSLRLSHTSTSSSTVKTPTGKVGKPKKDRSSHNIIEKKYRTNINAKILELRDAVPTLRAVNESERISLDELEGLTPAVKLNKATYPSSSCYASTENHQNGSSDDGTGAYPTKTRSDA
ncbi:unnamed protein product [Ambrosiozyma monospora]|uniref:Unnamed protein product n=1 Tax=Ambrosiozyma monospora TaxID=43982 RepID=A0A9W6Z4A5_AMBMO|nr:unnamed protein product [Ambrosiozyma monospora]